MYETHFDHQACSGPLKRVQIVRMPASARVSIHAPAGGATVGTYEGEIDMKVSIHAPAGGATAAKILNSATARVSIHAPAGGATRSRRPCLFSKVFQSTPPQGGRPAKTLRHAARRRGFNPRPRRGGDLPMEYQTCHWGVSIHAPAGGATLRQIEAAALVWCHHIGLCSIYKEMQAREQFPLPVEFTDVFHDIVSSEF